MAEAARLREQAGKERINLVIIGEEHWRHVKSLFLIVTTFILMSIAKLSLPLVLLVMAPIAIYLYRPSKKL